MDDLPTVMRVSRKILNFALIRDTSVQLMDLVRRSDDIQTEGEGFEKSTLDVTPGKTLIRATVKCFL